MGKQGEGTPTGRQQMYFRDLGNEKLLHVQVESLPQGPGWQRQDIMGVMSPSSPALLS